MNAATIQKYNKATDKHLEAEAVKYFNRFIRLRDTDEYGYGNCISSGQPLKYGQKNAQAGHWFPAGKFKLLKFNEDNVHLQGLSDNYYNNAGGPNYRINLVKKIGEQRVYEVERIAQINKRISVNRDRFFYIEIIEKYKNKCKELIAGKMF
jgi:hypothetical protein